MKLLNAIQHVAEKNAREWNRLTPGEEQQAVWAAQRFLYGAEFPEGSESKKQVTREALALLEQQGLTGDDFSLVGNGSASVVFGNGTKVLKLDYKKSRRRLISKDVPEEAAAKIFASGKCNGVGYTVCEHLDTSRTATPEEIVSYLFKWQDRGIIYTDAQKANFGHSKTDGTLKALDYADFQSRARNPQQDFAGAVERVTDYLPSSLVFSDDRSTYVLTAGDMNGPQREGLRKKLKASLQAVGMDPDAMETIGKPPHLFRIAQTEVHVGTPPQAIPLAHHIQNGLQDTIRDIGKERSAQSLLSRVSRILKEENAAALAQELPSAEALGAMDRKAFLEAYDRFTGRLESSGVSEMAAARIERLLDGHFKQYYAAKSKGG